MCGKNPEPGDEGIRKCHQHYPNGKSYYQQAYHSTHRLQQLAVDFSSSEANIVLCHTDVFLHITTIIK